MGVGRKKGPECSFSPYVCSLQKRLRTNARKSLDSNKRRKRLILKAGEVRIIRRRPDKGTERGKKEEGVLSVGRR